MIPRGSLAVSSTSWGTRNLATHPVNGLAHIKAELARGTDADFEAALRDEQRREIACFETDEVRARLREFVDRRRQP